MACMAAGSACGPGIAMTTASMSPPAVSSIVRKSRKRGADGKQVASLLGVRGVEVDVAEGGDSDQVRGGERLEHLDAAVADADEPHAERPVGRHDVTAGAAAPNASAHGGMTDRAAAVPSDDERNWRLVTEPAARLSRCVATLPISSDGAPGDRDELDRRLSYRLAARGEIRNPANRSDHVQFLRKTEHDGRPGPRWRGRVNIVAKTC